MFFNDINHGYRTVTLKKNPLWLLPFFMAVATSYYYGNVRRTMRTAIASQLLNRLVKKMKLNTYKTRLNTKKKQKMTEYK